jgi:hypothetical protein
MEGVSAPVTAGSVLATTILWHMNMGLNQSHDAAEEARCAHFCRVRWLLLPPASVRAQGEFRDSKGQSSTKKKYWKRDMFKVCTGYILHYDIAKLRRWAIKTTYATIPSAAKKPWSSPSDHKIQYCAHGFIPPLSDIESLKPSSAELSACTSFSSAARVVLSFVSAAAAVLCLICSSRLSAARCSAPTAGPALDDGWSYCRGASGPLWCLPGPPKKLPRSKGGGGPPEPGLGQPI